MLRGLNHITLTVSDLDASLSFYSDLLGMTVQACWDRGAYLTLGELWFCLSLGTPSAAKDYSHLAFDIADAEFDAFTKKLLRGGVRQWQENLSEGRSLYILDPDGHKLEIHAGNLASRLEYCEKHPFDGFTRSSF